MTERCENCPHLVRRNHLQVKTKAHIPYTGGQKKVELDLTIRTGLEPQATPLDIERCNGEVFPPEVIGSVVVYKCGLG